MNKLLTNFNGKMPWFLDDWRFQNDEFIDLLNSLAESINDPISGLASCVVSGCRVTDGVANWNITAGWVMIDNEFRRVAATSIAKDVTKVIVVSQRNDINSTGNRLMGDNTPVEPWQRRDAVITAKDIAAASDIVLIQTSNQVVAPISIWSNNVRQRIGYGAWINISSLANSWVNTPGAQARLTPESVEFRGRITNPTPTLDITTDHLLFTLTSPYRPSIARIVMALIPDAFNNDSEWSNIAIIEILTNGQVRLRGDLRKVRVNDAAGLSLDGVSFSL